MNAIEKIYKLYTLPDIEAIAININLLADVIDSFKISFVKPILNREILKKGIYATIYDKPLYVSKYIEPDNFKVPSIKIQINEFRKYVDFEWGINIPFDLVNENNYNTIINKINKIKAFM